VLRRLRTIALIFVHKALNAETGSPGTLFLTALWRDVA
jgi:hypothetical protein